MGEQVYIDLMKVMKKRGGDFPGDNIPEFYEMAEELFTPIEAAVNNAMPSNPITAKDLARRLDSSVEQIEEILESMASKGLCLTIGGNGNRFYQAVPFMPGIFEFQFMPGRTTKRERKLAKLIHAFKDASKKKHDFSAMTFPNKRVITVDRMIEAGNKLHTYDQVQTYIEKNETISVSTCYCRHAAILRDEDTHGMPNDVCMQFGFAAEFCIEKLGSKKVSKEEAMQVLKRSEEAGLLHMGQNMAENTAFICNCDRWHCATINCALAKPKPGDFFNSGFEPRFDRKDCLACEKCIDRCPSGALAVGEEGFPEVDLDRCFGCAVCATGCPQEAIKMVNKHHFPQPPRDEKALKAAISEYHGRNA